MKTPHGYRLAHNMRECASPHALVFDTDLRYWRKPTAWEIQSPTAIIAVPHTEQSSDALRGCLSIVTAIAIVLGIAVIFYVALHI
jgi:hypothetical protein